MALLNCLNCILVGYIITCLHNCVIATTDRKIELNVTGMVVSHSLSYANSLHVEAKLRIGIKACKKHESDVECKSIYRSDLIEGERNFAFNHSEYHYESVIDPDDRVWTGIVLENVETDGKESTTIGVTVEGTLTELNSQGVAEEVHNLNASSMEVQEFESWSTFSMAINDPDDHLIIFVSGTILCPKDHYGCDCERNCTPDNIYTHCDVHGRKTCVPGSYPQVEGHLEYCQGRSLFGTLATEKMCERQCYRSPDDPFTCNACGYKSCHYGYHHTALNLTAGQPDTGTCERVTCSWPSDQVLFPSGEGLTRCANGAPCVDHSRETADYGGFYDCDCDHISTAEYKYYGLRCDFYEEIITTTEKINTTTTTTSTTTTITATKKRRTTTAATTDDEVSSSTQQTTPPTTPAEDIKNEKRFSTVLPILVVLFAVGLLTVVALAGIRIYKTYQLHQASGLDSRIGTSLGQLSTESAVSMSGMSSSIKNETLSESIENPHYDPL